MSAIPVIILHGFLGSGKTTLLRNIIEKSFKTNEIPAVIVNDMSELDIDGVLIAKTEVLDEDNDHFVTISGDSISSTSGLKKLNQALLTIQDKQVPPWLIIETSGSSHPLPLIEYFKKQSDFALKSVITLIDAIWLRDDFDAAKTLVPRWQNNIKKKERGIENLLVEQIMLSNQIFISKSDKVTPEVIQKIANALHPINPYASIISTSWGNVSLTKLRQAQNYNFFLVEQLITELKPQINLPFTLSGMHNQEIVAQVIKDDRPFHPMRLWNACLHHLTQGVFRSKGFFWLPTRDDVSLLWSQANGSVGLEITVFWRAGAILDKSQHLIAEHIEILQAKIDKIDSRFGDRRCRLTVIGQENEVEQFVGMLNDCFLTDDEIAHWRAGKPFDDP